MKEGPKEKGFFRKKKLPGVREVLILGVSFFSFFSQLTQCQNAKAHTSKVCLPVFPWDICGLFRKDPVLRIEMIASVTLCLCPQQTKHSNTSYAISSSVSSHMQNRAFSSKDPFNCYQCSCSVLQYLSLESYLRNVVLNVVLRKEILSKV